MNTSFKNTPAALIEEARACTICAPHLPLGPRPVFQISPAAKILVVGQAPGIRVHETGIPFNDPSGDRLREWMGIDSDTFYDPKRIGILPMGFCYPGRGSSGDLPPRKECAPAWREKLLAVMPEIKLTLVIGQYAHKWHLGDRQKKNLTQTVKNWREYKDQNIIPLPHPSPRNNIWLKKNPWFESGLLPVLKKTVAFYLEKA
ncbi:MAG: uracil-DNA glycosylase family protein [Alphaproteobacteria bacterium]